MKMHKTLLFAPGSRAELLEKSQSSAADAIIFDLEDSVASSAKAQARENIKQALAKGLTKPMYLRVNHPESEEYILDIEMLKHSDNWQQLEGIILPKAENQTTIQTVASSLSLLEQERPTPQTELSIIPLIETCLGLRNTYEIAKSSTRVRGLSLASAEQGDFMADLGGHWTPQSLALMYPRSKLVAEARAAGVTWLIDGVFMNLDSDAALQTECKIARELGFVAKMAIHPKQLSSILTVFLPTSAEIKFARGLLAAFKNAVEQGQGAIRYEGVMVDYANARLAERTLALAEGTPCQ